MIDDKPRPAECFSCSEKTLVMVHCPGPGCNWTQCKRCGAITAVVHGKLKAIAGRT